jgi:hypothetical protein
VKLVVAVLLPEMTVPPEALQALLALQTEAAALDWRVDIRLLRRSRADESRNQIASAFLAGEGDALLLLSADIVVPPETVVRMVRSGHPVVGSLYPSPPRAWTRLSWAGQEVRAHRPVTPSHVGELLTANGGFILQDGFAPALHVGGGCLLLRRAALQRMAAAYPELAGAGFRAASPPDPYPRWGFFNRMDQPEGPPLRGDFAFCRRWRALGGQVWADLISPVAHLALGRATAAYADPPRQPV